MTRLRAAAAPGAVTVALLGAAWLVLVTAFYYRQIWRVTAGGLGSWPVLDGPRDYSLPFLEEAVRSAAGSVMGASVLTLAAVGVGLAVARLARWELDGAMERFPMAAGIGVGALAYLGLALAAVGAYRPWVLRAIVASVLIAWLAWSLLARPSRSTDGGRSAAWRTIAGADRVWLLVASLALVFALYAALAPVTEYDALWFHLHFPNVFLEHGRLVDLRNEYVSLYPMMWELWFGYGLAFGGANAAALLHYATLPLTAMVVLDMTRRYARPASPWLAAALFVTVPTVVWEGGAPYVDLAFTFHVSLMLLALLRYRETRRAQWLVLASLNLGFALATKHVGLIVLAIACAGTALIRWSDDRRLGPALCTAALLGAGSLLVPLPWYLRAWLTTGNPVFPELYGIFGAPAARWDEVARAGLQRFFDQFGRPRTFVNQVTLPWDMTMHEERYGGALGPLFLALVPLAALRLWRGAGADVSRGSGPRVSALSALTLFTLAYVVLWASPIASFQLRWVLAVAPALAVLAAVGYERLSALTAAAVPRAAGAFVPIVGALLLLNLPPFTPLHEHERRDWSGGTGWLTHVAHGVPLVVVGAESRDAYLRRLVPTYGAWQAAQHTLPPDARVLTWSGGDHFFGTESRIWVFSPAVRAAASAPAGDERRALDALRSLGITHILIDKGFLRANRYDPGVTWESYALTNARTAAEWYERLYEDDRALLYRIRWDSSARLATRALPLAPREVSPAAR